MAGTGSSPQRVSVEVRWFWSGPAPDAAIAWVGGRTEHRRDHYICVGELHTTKLRGGTQLETKTCTHQSSWNHEHLDGTVETWHKRYDELDSGNRAGAGLDVTKTRWRRHGVEVVAVDISDTPSWSVAVRVDRCRHLEELVMFPYAHLLRREHCASYAVWLATHHRHEMARPK